LKTKTTILSSNSFKDLAKFIDSYKLALEKGQANGIQKLVEIGKERVIANSPNISGARLESAIKTDVTPELGRIYTNDEVIVFNEFGTGIVGSNNSHPEASAKGWRYDVNEHGEKGWYYEGDDGEWHWTKGLPASKMFFNTKEELRQIAKDTMTIELNKSIKDIY
jgi:predicted dehydrogenase